MDTIKFHCPACRTPLTVPPSAAGFEGPCPHCGKTIVGPDPARNLPARRPAPTAETARTFAPFPSDATIPPTPPLPGPKPQRSPLSTGATRPAEEVSQLPPKAPLTRSAPPSTETPACDCSQKRSPPRCGISLAVLILSSLCSGILAFIAGYLCGFEKPAPSAPIFTTSPASESTAAPISTLPNRPSPSPIPKPPAPALGKPDEPSTTSGRIGSRAALDAFLNATDWTARSAYVQTPSKLAAKMQEHAGEYGDGPIASTRIAINFLDQNNHIYQVFTEAMHEGFPVALSFQDQGWLVDWELFTEYHDDRFRKFSKGKGKQKSVFHLLLNHTGQDDAQKHFAEFKITPPIPNRSQTAYVQNSSLVHQRLVEILENPALSGAQEDREQSKTAGIPLILTISYHKNSQDQPYLLIDDIHAVSWGPSAR